MEEEKIIEDGNNEVAIEQNAPVEQPQPTEVEVQPVQEPVVEQPVTEVAQVPEVQPVQETPVETAPVPETQQIQDTTAPVEPAPEAPKKKGKIGLILVLLAVVALGGFAAWYFALGGDKVLSGKKDESAQEEQKEENKEEQKEDKKEEDKKDDETISDELLTELKTIALLDTKNDSYGYNPLLKLNGSPNTLTNDQIEFLIFSYAQRKNLLKEFKTMEACLGGSGVCYGIPKDNLNGVLKKYGITNFDSSSLREVEGTLILGGGGDMVQHDLEHNITTVKNGDSIIITDKMDFILISTKEKDGKQTKEYTFKKNTDGEYYLSTVSDK
jgi:hypothetical protein